ncbi:MAG: carboxypeptidase regulatory-like domain-containing protein [Chitinophagaceae bacterium]
MLKRILFLIAIAFVAVPAIAQVTTSSISGTVSNATGENLAGASITAVHQPSGTRYSAISQSNGRFSIPNMRVGGPYHVEITYVGFDPQKFDDVYLRLGEDFLLNTSLGNKDNTLANVQVSAGRRNPIMNSSRTGAVTNIGRREIERLPSITRNINDLTRVTPQANGTSVAGGNYRQNNFTVDGADFNNSFGIGNNLPAGGSPISLDALDEISVSITPFDIRQSGFIGSSINAVTRSGTNTFSGSVYRYWRSEKQQGDKVGKSTFTRPAFNFEQYGVRVGGPIIKNKLFFFFNYETENQPKQVQTLVAATASSGPGSFGSANNIARPLASEMDAISNYLRTNYGYETGPYDNYNTEIKRTKYLGRIDWNINQNHKLTVRYSQVEGGEPFPVSTSTTGSNFSFPADGGRLSRNNTHLYFKNTNYFQGANFYSAAVELNSRFGKVANVFRGTYTYQNDSRESDSELFPLVDILKDGSAFATFGYEPFSYGNLRKVKMYSLVDNLTWISGKHNWLVGAQADFSETINGFQRFGTSYYVYNSWADFTSGAKPANFALTYSLAPGFAQAFPSFKFAQYSVYGQDEISASNRFKITLGLRLDLPTYPDVSEIQTHPLVAGLTFANGEKINTGVLPKQRLMWSPRLGFNYDIYGDRSLQIRGGTGIFTGKIPFVWIVSQSGDAGMLQVTQAWSGQANTPGVFSPNPNAYRPATVPAAGTVIPGTISAMAPDFKFPQTWKSSLGIDSRLGKSGIIFTLEAIYGRYLNTAVFRNANLVNPSPLNVSGYADNRLIYPNSNTQKFVNPLTTAGLASPTGTQALNATVIDNADGGHYFSLTAKLEKQFTGGLSAFISYTKSYANILFDGSGDQPLSAWQSTNTVNGANIPTLGYASHVVPDRVVAAISYRKEYIKHLATTVSVFYSGSIDGRFSYVYGADFNRDGFNGNDLVYIPKDASEITFVPKTVNGITYSAQEQSDLFFKYVEQDKYLRKHKGQYAERNGGQFPWRNQVDVRFMQDLFTNIGKNRNTLQFSIDIFNFGNLLNSSWSEIKTLNTAAILVPTNQASLVPGGTVKPTFQLATDRTGLASTTFRDNLSITSTYYMQFGIRYLFN